MGTNNLTCMCLEGPISIVSHYALSNSGVIIWGWYSHHTYHELDSTPNSVVWNKWIFCVLSLYIYAPQIHIWQINNHLNIWVMKETGGFFRSFFNCPSLCTQPLRYRYLRMIFPPHISWIELYTYLGSTKQMDFFVLSVYIYAPQIQHICNYLNMWVMKEAGAFFRSFFRYKKGKSGRGKVSTSISTWQGSRLFIFYSQSTIDITWKFLIPNNLMNSGCWMSLCSKWFNSILENVVWTSQNFKMLPIDYVNWICTY